MSDFMTTIWDARQHGAKTVSTFDAGQLQDAYTAALENIYDLQSERDALRQQVTDLTARAERAESEYDTLAEEADPGGRLRDKLAEYERNWAAACRNTKSAIENGQRWQQEAEAARAEVARLRDMVSTAAALWWKCGSEIDEQLSPYADESELYQAFEAFDKHMDVMGLEYRGNDERIRNYYEYASIDPDGEPLSSQPTAHSEPADGPRLAPGEDLPDDWTERDDEALGYAMMPPMWDGDDDGLDFDEPGD